MDSNRRIVIPQKLRNLVGLDFTKSYALCLEDDKIYYLLDTSEIASKIVLDVVSIDDKGRFVLDNRIIKHYKIPDNAEEFIFVQNNKIYISFSEWRK